MSPVFMSITFMLGILTQLALLNQVDSNFLLSFLPDIVLLFVVFWAMRTDANWYIWFAAGVGFLMSVLTDQKIGMLSLFYALAASFMQHARLRLLVVSNATQFSFACSVLCCYHLLLSVAFRFSDNGLQLPLLNSCVGAVLGWIIINALINSSAPLYKGKDLFS